MDDCRADETRDANGGIDVTPRPRLRRAGGKVFVKSYGCQMNVYDSERITEALAQQGYAHTASIEDADLVVLNTCHIREKAVEKVYSELGRVRELKDARAADGRSTLV